MVVEHLLFTHFLCVAYFVDLLFGLLQLVCHVILVCLMIILFAHALLAHLVSKHIIQLLVFRPGFILVVDVSKFGLLISGDALLDVLFLLAKLQLFAVIANHVAHCVHLVLDAFTARSELSLTSVLFFQGHSHILLNLFRFVHFRLLRLIG